jgi:hypothetical protein
MSSCRAITRPTCTVVALSGQRTGKPRLSRLAGKPKRWALHLGPVASSAPRGRRCFGCGQSSRPLGERRPRDGCTYPCPAATRCTASNSC